MKLLSTTLVVLLCQAGDTDPLPENAIARLSPSRWNHGGPMIASALSKDGKWLATLSVNSVAIFEVASGRIVKRLPVLPFNSRYGYFTPNFSFSPDGKYLGIAISEDWNGFWNLETGRFRRLANEKQIDEYVFSHFTDDGQSLVQRSCFAGYRVVEFRSMRALKEVQHKWMREISPDSRMCVYCDLDGDQTLSIRDANTSEMILAFKHKINESPVQFSSDSRQFAIVNSKDKVLEIWDIESRRRIHALTIPDEAAEKVYHTNGSYELSFECRLLFSRDGSQIFYGPRNMRANCLYRWDLETGRPLPNIGCRIGEVVGIHESVDGREIIFCGDSGHIVRFAKDTGEEIETVERLFAPQARFSKDGKCLIVVDSAGRISDWNAATLEKIQRKPIDFPAVSELGWKFDISADGSTLAVRDNDFDLRIVDLVNGKCETINGLFKSDDEAAGRGLLHLSPNGQLLFLNVAGMKTWQSLMIDTQTRKTLWKGEFESNAQFTSNSRSLAIPINAFNARLLDAVTGKAQSDIRFSDKKSRDSEPGVKRSDDTLILAFSPDGRHVAVTLGDETSHLFKAGLAKVAQLETSKSYPKFTFSRDGKLLAAGVHNRIHIWETATGDLLTRLEGHTGRVYSISFDPLCPRLVSCGDDNHVYVWALR